ncbi:MAG: glycosyltransferase [Patescibacteria group bacterium]
MNVLQINTTDARGGAAKVAYLLKIESEKRGHTTSMFVGRKYSDNEKVYLLNDVQSFTGKIRRKLAYYLANDIDVFSSDHILKTEEFKKADVIHCHNLHSNYFNLGTLEKISRFKPVVWTFHDMWPITAHCAHAFDGKLKESGFFTCPNLDIYPPIAWHNEKYLEKRRKQIYEKSNFHIVTPSKWLGDKVGLSILKDKPLTVIYNGIDTEVFKPIPQAKARLDIGLPLNKKIVLTVAKRGKFNLWKGGGYAQEIINSSRDRSDLYFVNLGGNGNDHLQTNIKTVSYVKDETLLAKYYSAANVLLYPSIADNCPLVVLEAQACGLPVIAFNTGGIPELIEHQKTGFIADYKNLDDLKTGLNFILNLNDIQIKNFREDSVKNIADNFSKELMVNSYIQLYQKEVSAFNSPDMSQ